MAVGSTAVFRLPHSAPSAAMRVPEKESQPIPPTQQLSGSALRADHERAAEGPVEELGSRGGSRYRCGGIHCFPSRCGIWTNANLRCFKHSREGQPADFG